jgi:lipoprotein-anchoring transpeptidase ErfK/SrfK
MTKFTSVGIIAILLFSACAGEKAASTSSNIKTAKETNLKIVNTFPISGYIPLEIRNIVLPITNNCSKNFINFNSPVIGGPIITRLDDGNVFMQINTLYNKESKWNSAAIVSDNMQKVMAERKMSQEFGKAYETEFNVIDALNKTIADAKKGKQLVYIFSKATQKLTFSEMPIYNNEEVLRNAIARDLCNNDNAKDVTIIYGINDKLMNYKPATAKTNAKIEEPIEPTPAKTVKIEAPIAPVKKADLTKPTTLPNVKTAMVADSIAKKPTLAVNSKTTTPTATPTATTIKTDPKALPKKDLKVDPKKDDKKGGLEKENIRKNVILKSDTQ